MLPTWHRMHGNAAVSFLSARIPSFVCLSAPSFIHPHARQQVDSSGSTTLLHASSSPSRHRRRYFEAARTDLWSTSLYRSSGNIFSKATPLHEERLPSVGRGTHRTPGGFFAINAFDRVTTAEDMSDDTEATTTMAPAAVCGEAVRGTAVAERGPEELALDREEFVKEFSVVAVKIPARRTRCACIATLGFCCFDGLFLVVYFEVS